MIAILALTQNSMAFRMISMDRSRTAGSWLPRGYLRWPDRHMVRMGVPAALARTPSSLCFSADQSSLSSLQSVSSTLISSLSKPHSLVMSNIFGNEYPTGMAFS